MALSESPKRTIRATLLLVTPHLKLHPRANNSKQNKTLIMPPAQPPNAFLPISVYPFRVGSANMSRESNFALASATSISTTHVWHVMKENPTSITVPPIQPAYENARGMDNRPIPTSTAIALNSFESTLLPRSHLLSVRHCFLPLALWLAVW